MMLIENGEDPLRLREALMPTALIATKRKVWASQRGVKEERQRRGEVLMVRRDGWCGICKEVRTMITCSQPDRR